MAEPFEKPAQCADCSLSTVCLGFARPWGNPLAKYRFCAEAAGAEEAAAGWPMVGASGHILFEAFKLAGVPSKACHCTYGEDRFNCLTCRGTGRDFSEHVYVYNLVQCKPPGNDFSTVHEHYHEVARCQSKYVAPAPEGAITFLVGGKALEYHFPGYTSIEVWTGSLLLKDVNDSDKA